MPQRAAETRPVAKILRAAFSVALMCLVLAGVAGFVTLAVTVRAFSNLIERELPLLIANDQILQGLTDAETAERGFLLTGDPAFLDRYEPGVAQFHEAIREAERLADASPELQALITGQDESGRAWLEEFAEPILELRAEDPDAAISLSRSRAGEQSFEDLRALNSQTEALVRDRINAAWIRALVSIWIAGTILSALVIITLTQGVRAAARATDAVTGPLGRLVATLERLSAGDLSARADVHGPSEITAVAQALNDLADENERLIDLNRQRLTVAGRIRRVAALLHSQLQVEPVVACAVSEAGRILADRAAVHRVSADEHEVLAAWCGPGIAPLSVSGPLPYPEALLAELGDFTHGQQVVEIADVETDERFDRAARDLLLNEGIRAAMLAQLRGGAGETLILAVHTAHVPRHWSSIDVALFEGIVREARDALANASAFEHQQQVVEQLRRLDEEKSAFLSNVSHELRTPLTSIIGYLELLEGGDAGSLSKDQVGLVKTVSRNSKRLLDLIEELLLLSRIESGRFTMARDPIAFADVIRDVVDTLRPQFLGPSARLRVDVAEDIGTVLGDRHQLERVLFNLLTNAAKFTPAGGEVHITAATRAGVTEIKVADTGIGIPRHEQGRVFDRFFRSSNAQEHAIEGTGLGLAIAKSIVERHDGTITVSSNRGEGTTFTVQLPLAESAAAQPAAR
ncbi:MAG TPA: ATP-binding protein [Egibacteraceae bacterium]|nr:ATP-binding protein [Egibacteraceae bacterium]